MRITGSRVHAFGPASLHAAVEIHRIGLCAALTEGSFDACERLWEIGDIVDVLEAFENRRATA
jgi:hypothetical protein